MRIALSLLLSPFALGQAPVAPSPETARLQRELAAARAEIAELRSLSERPTVVTGAWGADFTTAYFFRGIPQENQGVIAQPWFSLSYRLDDGGGFVHDASLTLGAWNSLHDGPTGGAGSTWYESDFSADLSAKLGEHWSLGTTFTLYDSPNGSFGTVQEVAAHATVDDHDVWFASGLQPSVTFAFETAGQADGGDGEGIYAQFGIAPSFALGLVDGLDLSLQLPAKVGLSVHDYYETAGGGDDVFGYADAGVVLSTTLPGLPRQAGPWQLTLGLHALVLGPGNADRDADRDLEWIGTVGLSTTF